MGILPSISEMGEKDQFEIESLLEEKMASRTSYLAQRPSTWLCPQWQHQREEKSCKPLSRTAYLDGLRGFAALLVYILHHEIWAHSRSLHESFVLERGFGRDNEFYFVCMPFVRIFFAGGHFAVAIFFIISGYVLSAKPLALVQNREVAKMAESVGSALFRRWIRLFIPVIGTTFVWMTCWHIFHVKSSNDVHAIPAETWFQDVWRWYCDFKNYSFIFNGDIFNAYNDHAWSLPLEFRGSVVVYTSVVAFSSCKTNVRLALEGALVWYFLYIVDGWYCALFVMGMLLCDLDLLAEKNLLPKFLARVRSSPRWILYIVLAASLYLGGVPSITDNVEELQKTPGWHLLSFLKPQAVYDVRWFFRFWAASLAMMSLPYIPQLRAFFETSFCQYLGRISFGLYLVHGPILWTVADRLYAAVGRAREASIPIIPDWVNAFPLPDWGIFGLEINFLLPQLVLLPFTLWMAELATKAFDEPAVRFCQWLLRKCTPPKQEG